MSKLHPDACWVSLPLRLGLGNHLFGMVQELELLRLDLVRLREGVSLSELGACQTSDCLVGAVR